MKKIFTLAIGSLFALSVMAADHQPSVTVKSSKKYEIVIDGKSYKGNSYIDLSGLYPGYHSIKVYSAGKRSFFGKRSRLISTSDFSVKRNDVVITVDSFGQVDVNEIKFGRNRGWGNQDFPQTGRDIEHGRKDHKDGHNRQF